jgi:hypothetical protein
LFRAWGHLPTPVQWLLKGLAAVGILVLAGCGASGSPASTASGSSSSAHPATTAPGTVAPASPSPSTAPVVAGRKCPAGLIAAANRVAVPAQQELQAAGFTPDTSLPFGDVYVVNTTLNIHACGWTGYYLNQSLGLTAGVGEGEVSFLGTGQDWISLSWPQPPMSVYETIAKQALGTSSIWSGLRLNGPVGNAQITVNGTTYGVDVYMTTTPGIPG